MEYTLTVKAVHEWRTGYAAKYGDLPNNREIKTVLVAACADPDMLQHIASHLKETWNRRYFWTIEDLDGNPPPPKPPAEKVNIGGVEYNIEADLVDRARQLFEEVSDDE